MHRDMQGAVAFTRLSSECDWAMSIGHRNYGTKHTLFTSQKHVDLGLAIEVLVDIGWAISLLCTPSSIVGPQYYFGYEQKNSLSNPYYLPKNRNESLYSENNNRLVLGFI